MHIIENNLEVVEYENLLLPISIKIRELIQYENKRALCHWHDDIEIIKILSGSMNFYINGEIFHLIKDDILIVNSKQIHYGYEYNHDDCKFICLMVNPSVLKINKAMYRVYVIPIIENNGLLAWCLKNNEGKQLDRILFALIDWQEKSCRAKEWKLLSLVYDLWYQIYNLIDNDKNLNLIKDDTSDDVNIFKQMVIFIYQNYKKAIILQDIAKSGNVGKSKCYELFKRYVNKTPNDFVNLYRLEKSKILLKNEDLSITEVALECGFNSGSYYAELFKKYNGCTPRNFRKYKK